MLLLEDRARIARDLHDHVIQQLFAAGMTIQGVASGTEDPAAAALLERVVDNLDEGIRQIRTSIFQLRPTPVGTTGVRAAVLAVVAESARALGFEPQVDFDGPVDAVADGGLVADVSAVVRESLGNTARHAAATTSRVAVSATAARLCVEVADDGVGIVRPAHHSGLDNLRRRAEARGGDLLVTSGEQAGQRVGTVLTWTVPIS